MSITDVCNFRCTYCLPQGYKKNPGDMRSFMSVEEISRLVKALSELGVCKIRLTGGEPAVVQGTCLSSKKAKILNFT